LHPKFSERELLLAAQGAVQVALKEEGGAHTLLRGARNIAEGFKVDRANSSSSTSLIFALPAKISSFFVKESIDQSSKIYKVLCSHKPFSNDRKSLYGYIRVYWWIDNVAYFL